MLSHLGVGDCFGEMSLLDLGPRSASVRAAEKSTALEVTAGDLHKVYEKDQLVDACRWLLTGDGHAAGDYGPGGRSFTHRPLS